MRNEVLNNAMCFDKTVFRQWLMGRLLLLFIGVGIGFEIGIVFHICFAPGPFDTDSDSDPDSELLQCSKVCSLIMRNEVLNNAI